MKPLLFSVLPRPTHATRDGLAIRNFHLIRALSEVFRVRAFVLRPPHLLAGASEYPAGVEIEEFAQGSRGPRRAAAAAASLLAGGAYSPRLYRSRAMSLRLADAAARDRPSWIVAHSYHVGPLALGSGRPGWIDFHNLDSQIWERVSETASSGSVRAFARMQAPRVGAFERDLVTLAAGASCVSVLDAGELLRVSPASSPLVVPNGVDLSRYEFRPDRPGDGVLLFVGDLSWPPNADGLRWFGSEVWPLIRAALPRARVRVLGRSAPRDLVRLGSDWEFLGEGDDTRPVWASADAAIVPLRAAGGTRLKILEAAACGVPVVSTTVGAEGLELEPDREILLRDDPPAFADAAVRLLQDPPARGSLAAAARARVERRYDWRRIGESFAGELLRRSLP
ncbi:MAG: glycosyltransferase [Acidobacteriota bacterium]